MGWNEVSKGRSAVGEADQGSRGCSEPGRLERVGFWSKEVTGWLWAVDFLYGLCFL